MKGPVIRLKDNRQAGRQSYRPLKVKTLGKTTLSAQRPGLAFMLGNHRNVDWHRECPTIGGAWNMPERQALIEERNGLWQKVYLVVRRYETSPSHGVCYAAQDNQEI